MSVANLLKDIFTGNFTSAEQRIANWWSGVQPSVQMFITKAETDAGQLLSTEAETFVEDIISGGLTTASFVSAAKTIGADLLSKGITMGEQDIFAALNIAVGAKTSPIAVPAVPPAA